MMRYLWRRKYLWFEVLVGGLLSAWLILSFLEPSFLVDPKGQSLSEFLSHHPQSRVGTCAKDGTSYTIVTGSGPWYLIWTNIPGYVFNADGTLVEWTEHIGDGNEFLRKWNAARP